MRCDRLAESAAVRHTISLDRVEHERARTTLGSQYWVDFDASFMHFCSGIVVLELDGWRHSVGVTQEGEYLWAKRLPVSYLDPADDQLKAPSTAATTATVQPATA